MADTVLGKLSVILDAKAEAFNKAFDAATGRMKNLEKLGERMAKISGAAFAGLSGGIWAASSALEGSRQAELKLASAIKARGLAMDPGAIGAFASELQGLTTFEDDATVAAAAMLTRFVDTEDQLKTLLPGVQDLAAFMGTDLTTAADQVGKAIGTGTVGPLTRAGIAFDETQKKAFEAGSKMDRVRMISDALGKSVGGTAAALANTAGGAFAQLQNVAGDLLEVFGEMVEAPLVAMFHAATEALQEVVGWFSSLSDETKSWLGVGALVATAMAGIGTAVGAVLYVLPGLIAGFEVFGVTSLAALWPVVAAVAAVAAAIAGVILIIGALKMAWDSDLGGMRTTIKNFLTDVERFWKKSLTWVKDNVGKALDWLSDKFVMVASWLSGASPEEAYQTLQASRAGGGVFNVGEGSGVADMVDTVVTGAKAMWVDVGKTFRKGIETLGLDKLGDVFKGIVSVAKPLTDAGATGSPGGGGAGTPAEPTAAVPMHLGTLKIEAGPEVVEMGRPWMEAGDMVIGAGRTLASAMGDAGDVATAFAQGMASGGPIFAIINAILALVMKLEVFGEVVDIVNEDFGFLLEALDGLFAFLKPLTEASSKHMRNLFQSLGKLFEPIGAILSQFMEALEPIIGNTGLLGTLFETLGGLLQAFMPIIEAVMKVVDAFGIAIGFLALGLKYAFGWVINAFIDFVTEIIRLFPGTADLVADLQAARVDMGDIDNEARSLEARAQGTFGISGGSNIGGQGTGAPGIMNLSMQLQARQNELAALAAAELTTGLEDAGTAAVDLSHKIDQVNASLTNVPSGFKTALSRFNATDGTGGVGTTNYITAYSPRDMERQMQSLERDRGMTRAGSTSGGSAYRTGRAGS